MAGLKHVIIGNGPAGLKAIETIGRMDQHARITLISSDTGGAYSKMLLPYLISGQINEEALFIRDRTYYQRMGVETIFGVKVESVRPQTQEVIIGGSKVRYDNLLIASGAFPRRPPVPGLDQDGVLTLWTLEDARRIREKAAEAKDVLIWGGGLVGFKALECLERPGRNFTIVELEGHILPRRIDFDGAQFVEDHILPAGNTRVIKGQTVGEMGRTPDGRKRVVLEGGDELKADLVIASVGAEPNIAFLKDSGVATSRGILVDSRMRTNVPNIYAAGDVAESRDFLSGERVVHGIWPVAVEQGRVAGSNMVGEGLEYEGGLARSTLDVGSIPVASVGISKAREGHEAITFSDPKTKVYRRILFQDSKMVGATLIGRTDDCGLLYSLIYRGVNAGKWKKALATSPLDPGRILLTQN